MILQFFRQMGLPFLEALGSHRYDDFFSFPDKATPFFGGDLLFKFFMGVYSMIPLYLVSERGMERTWANTLLGLSRASTPAIALLSGWATDRFGVMTTLKATFITTGLITMMLGVAPGSWIILAVFLQPVFAACFFTPGFAALSRTVP
jgi:MFS family permease